MMNFLSPSLGGTAVLGATLVGLYLLYRTALPKPLEGIPYNQDAAGRLLGDVPEMMRYVMKTKRIFVRSTLFLIVILIFSKYYY